MKRAPIFEVFALYALLVGSVVFFASSFWAQTERSAIERYADEKIRICAQALNGLRILFSSLGDDSRYLAVQQPLRASDETKTRLLLREYYSAKKNLIASITRMDKKGVIVVTIPHEQSEQTSIADQPHVAQIIATQKPLIGGPIRTVQGFDALIIHTPVIDADSQFAGTIAILIPVDSILTNFLYPIARDNEHNVWLTNSKRRVLFHPGTPSAEDLSSNFYENHDTVLTSFLENFPPSENGFFMYTANNGEKKILCFATVEVGFERMVLCTETSVKTALTTIAPVKTRLLLFTFFAIILSTIIMIRFYTQRVKNLRIEQDKSLLQLSLDQQKRAESIYRFSNALANDMSNNILHKIVSAAVKIADVPLIMLWKRDKNANMLVPAEYCTNDYRFEEQLRNAEIDINSFAIPCVLGGIDICEAQNCLTFHMKTLESEKSALALILFFLNKLCGFTHITLVPLQLRGVFFGCLAVPSSVENSADTEILEHFRLSISQVLFIEKLTTDVDMMKSLLHHISDSITTAIAIADEEFRILDCSTKFSEFFELEEDLTGKDIFSAIPSLRSLDRQATLDEFYRTKTLVHTEKTYIANANKTKFTRTKVLFYQNVVKAKAYYIVLIDDLTESRAINELNENMSIEIQKKDKDISKATYHDSITKMRNYRYMRDMLPNTIRNCIADNKNISIVLLRIDSYFDYITQNDLQSGESMLMEIAKIIKNFLSAEDFAAYLGSNLFMLTQIGISYENSFILAKNIAERIAQTPFPNVSGTRTEYVTVSMGYACFGEKTDFSDEDILKKAFNSLTTGIYDVS